MPTQSVSWNSLEIVKLIVGFLTPVSVVVFGFFVSQRLKRLELVQWSNQKLIEKRLEVYDLAAPLLNMLLCFYTWVGNWKDISPDDVVKTKRELDRIVNIYRHIFDDSVYEAYQAYMHLLFEHYVGPGQNAKIRSHVKGRDGDRTVHGTFDWDQSWSRQFSSGDIPKKTEVRKHYYMIMDELRRSLGIQ